MTVTTPSITECRDAFVEKSQLTRQSARADNAEGSMNVTGITQYEVKPVDQTWTTAMTYGHIAGKALEYVSFIRPTVALFPTANIGDTCKVFIVDTSVNAGRPYTAEMWLFTSSGWERLLTGGGSASSNNVLFTVTSAAATVGAVYSNNGNTFTVVTTIAGSTSLLTNATGAPAASGTLTKVSGTGDATITFSTSAVQYPVYTGTANKILDIRALFTTASGDNKLGYFRAQYAGTTAQGEAVRAYAEVNSTATSVHGVAATGQVSAGGSIVGEVAGVRATAAVVTGLTLSGGELFSLRLDSDLSSAVTGLTSAAYLGIFDVQSTKMPQLMAIDGSATGCLSASNGNATAGTIKILVGGVQKYIQMYSSVS